MKKIQSHLGCTQIAQSVLSISWIVVGCVWIFPDFPPTSQPSLFSRTPSVGCSAMADGRLINQPFQAKMPAVQRER